MRELLLLEEIHGYIFRIVDKKIGYQFVGEGRPDPQIVGPLLKKVKTQKAEAVEFLKKRETLIDYAHELYSAAEKAEQSARQAEEKGNLERSRQEWKRFARLAAAAMKAAGATDPDTPWDEWIQSFND